MIDHELIQRIIIDNGGCIIGGYVRQWVSKGEPSDTGWSDIDCRFITIEGYRNANREMMNLNPVPPRLDLFTGHGKMKRAPDQRFFTAVGFNDFWCNCWMFDGKIKPFPPLLSASKTLIDEIREQNKNKIARMIPSAIGKISENPMTNADRVSRYVSRGWTIQNHDGTEPCRNMMRLMRSVIRKKRNSNTMFFDDYFSRLDYHSKKPTLCDSHKPCC